LYNSFLQMFSPHQPNQVEPDMWYWKPNGEDPYTVRTTYDSLSQHLSSDTSFLKMFWSNVVPPKVSTFGWRLFLGRLQTNVKLFRRGVTLPNPATLCSFPQEEEESEDHLLFACPFAFSIWQKIHCWMGIQTAQNSSCHGHFTQFINLGNERKIRSIHIAIWFATLWCLWTHRNAIIFRSEQLCINSVFEVIISTAWSWLRFRLKGFYFSFCDWYRNPSTCISLI